MNRTRRAALISLTAISCASCNTEQQQSNATADAPSPAAVAPAQSDATNPTLVTEHGIGLATTDITLGELRKSLRPGMRLGAIAEFMVDIFAIPIIAGTDTLYHAVMPFTSEPVDSMHVEAVVATHPRVQTAERVGPGTTLEEAAARYGKPTLSYNVNDESREWAEFPSFSDDSNIAFRVEAYANSSMAGTYATHDESNSTKIYDPRATIMLVWVNLRPRPAR